MCECQIDLSKPLKAAEISDCAYAVNIQINTAVSVLVAQPILF